MKILIVDDSVTFRTAIKTALIKENDIEIVGAAANGQIALQKLQDIAVDLMILDLEMPEMDGIQTLHAMREHGFKPSVIIFAAPTPSSYDRVRDALKAGADEFLAKPTSSVDEGGFSASVEKMKAELLPRIRLLGARKATALYHPNDRSAEELRPLTASPKFAKKNLAQFRPEAIVMAASTGGPMALETVFDGLKSPLRIPIFLVQHMPPPFTKSLADRLHRMTGIPTSEAQHGEKALPGKVYIAPAGFHMTLLAHTPYPTINLSSGPRINFVIPAADPLFQTAASIYKSKLMGFVLTGMGEDGRDGAVAIKKTEGSVMIQDEETSVVWGMPGAVYEAQAFDDIGPLKKCGEVFRSMASG